MPQQSLWLTAKAVEGMGGGQRRWGGLGGQPGIEKKRGEGAGGGRESERERARATLEHIRKKAELGTNFRLLPSQMFSLWSSGR